jgi:transcriptional regulator
MPSLAPIALRHSSGPSALNESAGSFASTENLVRETQINHFPLTFDKRKRNSVVDYRGGHELPTSTELLQGTLDLLVLQTLATGPMHGWGVAQRIQQLSKDVLQIGQGSLYPALYRLEYKGWIKSEWGNSENNRRAKFYKLTAAGKKQLETELETWDRLSAAVGLVLGRTAEASR